MAIPVPPQPAASRRAVASWVMAQAARDPYVIVITIYIFAPYFVTRVVGDAVAGQALVAWGNKWAGVFSMLTVPVIGATLDRFGPRKPLLAASCALMSVLVALLWFAVPKGSGLPGLPVAGLLAIAMGMSWLVALHDLTHNALLVPAAGVNGAARASGLALAGGNAVSVLMLVALLLAFALPGTVDWHWLPARPLLGLDPVLGEPARITGPLVAIVMALGSLPVLLWAPDCPRTGLSLGAAVRAGLADLRALFRAGAGERNVLLFLGARMIYTDALSTILIFGGLFAAGTMGWGTLEMLGYGIVLSIAAVAGGLLASKLDMAIGPRPAAMLEIAGLIIMQGLMLGMGRDRIIFMAVAPVKLWNGPMFTTWPEIMFLVIGCGLAITVTAVYASSRTILTRITLPERLGVFFGLYALSGFATIWLGPLLVEIATKSGGTQRAGLVPVLVMLAAGLALLSRVRGGGRL
jgi:UMF1 family MFS transporter